LPRELRDIVYEHLWAIEEPNNGCSRQETIREIRENAETRFADPFIVGEAFAREAYEWLYENGDLEKTIQLSQLKRYLFSDPNSVGINPADCKIRSLKLQLPIFRPWADSQMPNIESHFRPLLDLDLINGFKMELSVHYKFDCYIDVHFLADIGTQLQGVVEQLELKEAEVEIKIEFNDGHERKKQKGPHLSPLRNALFFPTLRTVHIPKSLEFEWDVVRGLLGFTATEWAVYVKTQPGYEVWIKSIP
tara:strand:- start:2098 stop:2841 length:744 start_codon:yes stop_codon:yes gene_type:complete